MPSPYAIIIIMEVEVGGGGALGMCPVCSALNPALGGVHTLTLPCRPAAARSPRCRRSRAGCGPPRCPSVPWGGGGGKGGAEVDPLGAASTHSHCRVALLPLARLDVDVVGRAAGRLGARLSRGVGEGEREGRKWTH